MAKKKTAFDFTSGIVAEARVKNMGGMTTETKSEPEHNVLSSESQTKADTSSMTSVSEPESKIVQPMMNPNEISMRHRNFKVPRELKSLRISFVLRPSIFEAFKEAANKMDTPVNRAIDEAMVDYIKKVSNIKK